MVLVSHTSRRLSIQLIATALVLSWTRGFARGVCESGWRCTSTSTVFCSHGHTVRITDAHFLNVKTSSLCDEDCTPAAPDEPDNSPCKRTASGCLQKLDAADLSVINTTCDASLSHCDLSLVPVLELSVKSSVLVEYTCIGDDGELTKTTGKTPIVISEKSLNMSTSGDTTSVTTVMDTTSHDITVNGTATKPAGFILSSNSLVIGFAAGFLVASVSFIVVIVCRGRGRTRGQQIERRQQAVGTSYRRREFTSGASSRVYNEILDDPEQHTSI